MTTGSTPGDLPPTTPTGTTGTSGTAAYGAAGTTGGTTGTTGSSGTSGTSQTRDVAKDEAKSVAQDAAQSGRQTAETAMEQAGQVADEAKNQAKQLIDQAREQVTTTGVQQKDRAASGLRSIADELTGMVNGEGSQSGVAADLARQASDYVRNAADMLENREPAELLQEVRRFARQRPGTFLLGAAAIGFLGGRLTRGLAADSDMGSSSGSLGSGRSSNSLSLTGGQSTGGTPTAAQGVASTTGTVPGDTVPTGPEGTGDGFGARTDFDRPAGGDAPLSGYAVPPERSGAEPHGDPTATFNPGSQSGGAAEDRI
jgi:vacuolar-type H+-ATPase subunit H